jgi:hypothetical protein
MKTHCKQGHELTAENTVHRTRREGGRECRACNRKRSEDNRAQYTPSQRKLISRASNLRSLYKMNSGDYMFMLVDQEYKCANPACTTMDTAEKRLHVDHDHSCCPGRTSCGKCVRRLLCSNCNLLLGLAQDNPRYLLGLAEYAQSWKKFTDQAQDAFMSVTTETMSALRTETTLAG